MWLMLEGREK